MRSRSIAVALVLALASGPVVAAAHLAAVRHATCADHGELVELAIGTGESHRHPLACIHQAPDERGHEHGHCTLATDRRPEGARNSRQPRQHLALDGSQVATPNQPLVLWQQPLLLLAPKGSPPV